MLKLPERKNTEQNGKFLAKYESRVSFTSELESSQLKPARGFAKPTATSATYTNYKIFYSRGYLCEPQNSNRKARKTREV